MEFFELFYSYYKQDFLEKRIREGEEEKKSAEYSWPAGL
jgi:hypothetical protein